MILIALFTTVIYLSDWLSNDDDNDDDDDDDDDDYDNSYVWLLIHYPFFQKETSELTNSLVKTIIWLGMDSPASFSKYRTV